MTVGIVVGADTAGGANSRGPASGVPASGDTARVTGTPGIPAAVTPEGAQAIFRATLDALCARAAERAGEADAAEWAELSPTIVQFEELK